MPIPHLRGGGFTRFKRGGALGVHADFNFYPRLNLYRRLNLLIYLNEDWPEAWGGDLELWDREGKRCVQRISPVFNRAVIFDTSNFSYHGHPATASVSRRAGAEVSRALLLHGRRAGRGRPYAAHDGLHQDRGRSTPESV